MGASCGFESHRGHSDGQSQRSAVRVALVSDIGANRVAVLSIDLLNVRWGWALALQIGLKRARFDPSLPCAYLVILGQDE